MKKSLSVLASAAMAFGAFASMASAADSDLTTAQKYQQLVDNQILKGSPDGDPHLSDNLTRAEFATIAVAVAGLQEDTTTTPAFSDVKAGQWWTGAIQAAKDAGLVDGTGNGMFSPKANVKVEEAIKVAVGIAGLTPVADATVDGADAWAGPYIKAAQDAGLPVPTNYTDAATRAQTIDMAYAVYEAKQVKPLTDVKATVNADDTITVTGTTAGGVDGVKVAIGTADGAAATLNADGTFTYTTTAQAVGTYKLTVTAYKGDTVVTSTDVSASIDSFQVSSVTLVDAKTVAVKFSKPVRVSTALTTSNYNLTIGGAPQTVSSVSVSDDGLTATVNFASPFSADTYGQFEVTTGVLSAGGTAVAAYKQPLYVNDTTAPSVTGVTFTGTIASVALSEELNTSLFGGTQAVVSVDGAVINPGSPGSDAAVEFKLSDDGKTITIGGSSDSSISSAWLKGSVHTIDIVGAQDLAGNTLPDYHTTVTVPNDTTKPVVSSVTVNGAKVTIKFSKPLAGAAGSYVHLVSNTFNGYDDGGINIYDSDNNQVTFDLKNDLLSTGASFVTENLTISGFEDASGNAGDSVTKTVTLTNDATAPALQNVTVDNGLIVAKFNEPVTASIGAGASVSYTDSDGVVHSGISITDAVAYYDADKDSAVDAGEDNYVVLTPSSLPAGRYTVTLNSGFVYDKAPTPNNAGSVSLSFTVSGSTSGTLALDSVTQSGSTLTLKLSSTISQSQLIPANFLINGAAVPAATTFYFQNDRQTVIMTLPAGSIPANGSRTVAIANLVDDSGNTVDTGNNSFALYLTENVAPKLASATFVSDKTISITFSENVTAATLNGVQVWVNGTQVSATVDNYAASGNTLTINYKTSVFATGQSVYVKTVSAGDIKDAAGNSAADGQVTAQ